MYRKVYKPGHARADITGMVPFHILVAEEKLGRPLRPDEIVHHCDFNKLNNLAENLFILSTRKQHQQFPAFQARFIIAKGLYIEFMEWWMNAQTKVYPEQEIEQQLVKAQNEQERIKAKLARISK